MIKKLKKDLQIMIDDKAGHLFFGDKKKNIRLLMLRPLDLIEFSEFAGSNADDILIWAGKTLGKSQIEKYFTNKDWSKETMEIKKDVILGNFEALELLGYGHLTTKFRKDHVLIEIEESIASDDMQNIMAKNLCLLYQGILTGMFDALQLDAEGEELECILLGGEKCVYKFELISVEVDESLIDAETEETVSGFLSTL